MSFDPMAAAVDWLDAYRAGDINFILGMYAHNAIINCGCGGVKTITGDASLLAYWSDRVRRYPAGELDDLQLWQDGATISYRTVTGVVRAVLTFNVAGKIHTQNCGPTN